MQKLHTNYKKKLAHKEIFTKDLYINAVTDHIDGDCRDHTTDSSKFGHFDHTDSKSLDKSSCDSQISKKSQPQQFG